MKGILINKSQRLVCHFKQAIIWSSFCLINTKPLSPARSICWHHMHCGSQPGCKTDLSWGNIPKQLVVLPVLEILDWSRNTCPFIFWPFFPYTVTKINTLWNLWHELKRVQQVEVRWKGTHMVTSLKSQMNKEISQPQTHNCTKKKVILKNRENASKSQLHYICGETDGVFHWESREYGTISYLINPENKQEGK